MYMTYRGLKLPLHFGYSKNGYSVFYMLVVHFFRHSKSSDSSALEHSETIFERF